MKKMLAFILIGLLLNNLYSYTIWIEGGNGTNTSCIGQNVSLRTNAVGNVGFWFLGDCNGPIIGTGTQITVHPTVSTTYLFTTDVNNCGGLSTGIFHLTVVGNPITPNIPIGDSIICPNSGNSTYQISSIGTSVINYSWKLTPSDAGSISGTGLIGTVIWNPSFTGNAYISVRGNNGVCDGSYSSPKNILKQSLPSIPSSISGPSNVCRGDNSITFSIPPISNATSYIWALPNGATGSSSTNSITIDFNFDALTSNISVKGVNSCGEGPSSSKTITVNRFPQHPGTISGSNLVCQGQVAVTYTVPTIGYATSYIWNLPNGATGTSSSNSITVNYGNSAVSGNISVFGNNSCGVGSTSITPITVNPLPSSAGLITGDSIVCQGQNSLTYSLPTINDATSYIWTLPSGATGTSSTNNILINYGTSAISGNITVKGNNICGNGNQSSKTITVNPLPSNAGTISGPSVVCKGQNAVTYTVPVISNATSYIWTLPNGVTGSSSTRSITVNYDTSAISGIIEVYGQNSCGNGNTYIIAITVNSFPSNAGIISGPIEVCQGQNSVSYSVPSIANANSYIWTLPNGVIGSSTNNNISVSYSTTAISGNIEVFGQNSCGVGNTSIKYIDVNPLPYNAGTISGASTVCQGENTVIYAVPNISNATSYIWTLPSGATGTSATNSININYGTTAVSSTISVKGNNDCGFGNNSSKSITVNSLPSNAGTISGTSTVCQGQNSITYTVPTITNATSYVWTLPNGATGNSTTNSITVNYSTSAISGLITVKGNNSCGVGTESVKSVTVNPLPSAAGIISGPVEVCQGQNSVTYIVPTIANATSYIWTLPSGASGSSSTNSITANFGNSAVSGNISVKGSNSCGVGSISIIPVILNPLPSNAGTITGSSIVCQEQNSVLYSVPSITNATSYVWTLPSGATGTSSTNSITINYGATATSSNISVKGNNDCGFGTNSSKSITVNPLPSNAGTISGSSIVCQGQNSITYTVPTISNTTSYVWTLPNGVTGSSNTNSITVNFTTSAISGIISVKGSNSCGFGAGSFKTITINPLPFSAGVISGPSLVCQGQNSITYTVPEISNATSYIWSLPSGVIGNSSTNSITVNFSASAISGNITVKGSNSCGYGSVSIIPITVNPLPSNAGIISGSSIVCKGQNSVSYSISPINNANSYYWNLPNGVVGLSSTNSITVNYSNTALSGSIEVYGQNSCGVGVSSIIAITVDSIPTNASIISGLSNVCVGQNSVTYSVSSIANATSYVWSVPNGVIGNSSNNSILLNFGSSSSSGNIAVYGQNHCGIGNPSAISVIVNPLPSNAETISGTSTVCQGQNLVLYAVPIIANATSYIWTLPNGATGTSVTNSININYGTTAVSSTISVKGNNDCGFGTNSSKSITVNPLPSNAGTISGASTVCQGQNSVTYSIPFIPNASTYIWTLPEGVYGNSSSNSITINFGLSAVSGNITVKGSNNCGFGSISSKYININPLPSNSGTIFGPNNVCIGQNAVTYSVPTIDNATSYVWTFPNGVMGNSSTNNILLNFGSSAESGQIQVYGQNSCGNGIPSILPININTIPSNAGSISGVNSVCQGQSSILYAVPTISNATSYFWTLPSGATGVSNTNTILVSYDLSSISGGIEVYGQNFCGNGNPSILAVNVNPLPGSTGIISGSTSVCQGENSVLYSVPSISNATNYEWTLPNGAIGTSNSNFILVNYNTSAVSGNIGVSGQNSCGIGNTSLLAILVNPLPNNPDIISGSSNVCQGESNVIYTIPQINNANSYLWTYPNGVYGSSSTNSISLDFGINANSGNVAVRGVNNCGIGNNSLKEITVGLKPITPIINLNQNFLSSNAPNGNQWYNQNGIIEGATNQNFEITENGTYYVIVSINDCSSNPSNSIYVDNVSILDLKSDDFYSIYPNPFSNNFNIESKNNVPIDIELVNSIGQLIYKENNIIQTTIQTQSIAPGLYFVKIKNNSEVVKIFKVIKN